MFSNVDSFTIFSHEFRPLSFSSDVVRLDSEDDGVICPFCFFERECSFPLSEIHLKEHCAQSGLVHEHEFLKEVKKALDLYERILSSVLDSIKEVDRLVNSGHHSALYDFKKIFQRYKSPLIAKIYVCTACKSGFYSLKTFCCDRRSLREVLVFLEQDQWTEIFTSNNPFELQSMAEDTFMFDITKRIVPCTQANFIAAVQPKSGHVYLLIADKKLFHSEILFKRFNNVGTRKKKDKVVKDFLSHS